MKQFISVFAILLAVFAPLSATAQSAKKTIENKSISGISVGGVFNVEIHYSETPKAVITIPEHYQSALRTSVCKDGILSVSLRGAGEPLFNEVYNIELHVSRLNNLTTTGNATVNCTGGFLSGEFRLNASGQSRINSLNLRGTRVIAKLSGQSSLNRSIFHTTHQTVFELEGSSSVLSDGVDCSALEVYTSGLSQLVADGTTVAGMCIISSKENSKVNMKGKTPYVKVKSDGSSAIDMLHCEILDIEVKGRAMSTVSCTFERVANVNMAILSEFRYRSNGRCEGNRNMIRL